MRVIPPEIVDIPINNSRSTTATFFDSSRVLRLAEVSLGYADYGGLNTTVGKSLNFDPVTGYNLGYSINRESTNLIINNDSITNTTRSIAVVAGYWYTLSFYGTGNVKAEITGLTTFTLVGSSTTTPVFTIDSAVSAGSTACPAYRVSQKFYIPLSGTLVLTITGTVRFAQLELGLFPTSIIVTGGSAVTRGQDNLGTIPVYLGSDIPTYQGNLLLTRASYAEGLGNHRLLPSFLLTDPTNYTDLAELIQAGGTVISGRKYIWAGWVYQALIGMSPGTIPNPARKEDVQGYWQFIGPDNPNAMFDSNSSQKTLTTSGYPGLSVFAFTAPEGASSISLHGLENISVVTITVNDRNGNIFSTSVSDNPKEILFDFPPWVVTLLAGNSDWRVHCPIVTVCISCRDTNFVGKIGQCIIGPSKELGKTQYGASISIIDYSTKTTDAFGNTTFVKRAYAKKMNARLLLDKTKFNEVLQTFYDIRSTPCTWITTDDSAYSKGALVYGYYKDFSVDITYPTMNSCSLEVEGLI